VSEAFHKPVLLEEVLQALEPASGQIFCDVTLGDGGHAKAILEALGAHGLVIGIDRDAQAIERAQQRLAPFGDRFRAIHGNFAELTKLLTAKVRQVDGIVCDLGVSMLQISKPNRGFMFSADGPLDMRMQSGHGLSAEQIINETSEKEIADIIWRYGEERKSRRIASFIVKARQQNKITTTAELAAIVRRAVGEKYIIKSLARVFQAFRIYVNDELQSLKTFLPQAVDVLRTGGRLAVIEYHSLESRLVKDFIYEQTHPCICPKDLPQCVCGREPRIKVVHKLIKPSEAEIKRNPSARSARLRVIEKLP
jgi:16S rRNA (cytosine1402-N4)-methyltransferase